MVIAILYDTISFTIRRSISKQKYIYYIIYSFNISFIIYVFIFRYSYAFYRLPFSSFSTSHNSNNGGKYWIFFVEIKVCSLVSFLFKRFCIFIRTFFLRSFNIFYFIFLQNEILFSNLRSFLLCFSFFWKFPFSTLFDPQFSPGTFVSIHVMAICKQWNRWDC